METTLDLGLKPWGDGDKSRERIHRCRQDGLCRLRSTSSLYYGWRSGRSGGGDGSADADE